MKDYKLLSDTELITIAASGNDKAFEHIVMKYERQIAKTVIGMLGNCQEADDVGQETFIRLYNSLSNFRGESALGTYIVRIAINLSLNELKKRKRRNLFIIGNNQSEKEFEIPDTDTTEIFDNKNLIQQALNRLEPKFKSVVVLRLIQGYSTKETAEILKTRQGTVLSRLSRAQKKLKEIMTYGK